jgi:hypothetical protein
VSALWLTVEEGRRPLETNVFTAVVKRRVLRPDDPPVAIHHASFHRLGSEVVMDLGFHDMATLVPRIQELQKSPSKTGVLEIDVTIFAQYAMGAETFARLRENVEQIYNAMVKSGHIAGAVKREEGAK